MRLILSCLTMFTVCASIGCPSVVATDTFSNGLGAYNHAKYKDAKIWLQIEVKDHPTNWLAHFYLGNSYMQLGDLSKAYAEYFHCLNNNPDSTFIKPCIDARSQIDAIWKARDKRAVPVAAVLCAKKMEPGETKDADLEKRRKQIIDDAKQKAKQLRSDAESQIAASIAGATQWFIFDKVVFDDSPAEFETEKIRYQVERQAEKIMKEAEKRAAELD